jgi:hypothetical protein
VRGVGLIAPHTLLLCFIGMEKGKGGKNDGEDDEKDGGDDGE